MFDKASQATSVSSGGLWGCRGGNEQIAGPATISDRERVVYRAVVELEAMELLTVLAEVGFAVRLTSSVCSFNEWPSTALALERLRRAD